MRTGYAAGHNTASFDLTAYPIGEHRITCQVERGDHGDFFILKNGSTIDYCVDLASLQAFERSLPKAKASRGRP